MTPDEHAKRAEELLDTAEEFRPSRPHYLGLVARAQVHATLSLRKPEPAPRKKPGPKPKKTTDTKEKDA